MNANGNPSIYPTLLLLLAMFAIMYFLMIRPQRKKDKETREMRAALKRGDKVVTIGGIVGTVNQVNDETVVLLVGKDRVKLEFLKTAIGSVTMSAPGGKADKEEEKEDAAPVNRDKKITPKKLSAKKPGKAAEKVEEVEAEVVETVETVSDEIKAE